MARDRKKKVGILFLSARKKLTEGNWYEYEQSSCLWLDKVPLWNPIDLGQSVHRECSSNGSL